MLQDGGADEDDIINARARYRGLSQEYAQFSKAMDLPQQRERIYGDGLGNIGKGKYTVAKSQKNGIIKPTDNKEVQDVHYIGKINKDIYSCITEDITTDEVVITDERIKHIKERHPNDFEKYSAYIKSAIESPEYIIEANKPNTAMILKSFSDGEEQFKTILRLITSSDNAEFKNSVITFMKINEKEWKRLIKNKKILYKSE